MDYEHKVRTILTTYFVTYLALSHFLLHFSQILG